MMGFRRSTISCSRRARVSHEAVQMAYEAGKTAHEL
jgi:hypothetical protein